MGRQKGKRTAERLEKADQEAQAVRLRRAGHTIAEIGQQLHVSEKTVKRWIDRTLARAGKAAGADEMRALMLDRLEAMLKALWTKAEMGDTFAIDRAVKIMERQAKLAGLDAPTNVKHRVEGEVDHTHTVALGQQPPEDLAQTLQLLVQTGQLRLPAPAGAVIEGEVVELPAEEGAE
jgi:hypothetical protein